MSLIELENYFGVLRNAVLIYDINHYSNRKPLMPAFPFLEVLHR